MDNYFNVDGLLSTRVDYCKGRSTWSADTIFETWTDRDDQAIEAIDLTNVHFDRGYYLDEWHSVAVLQKGNEVFKIEIYSTDDTQIFPLELLWESSEFPDMLY